MTTLIATGKAKKGTAHMELWRKEDYTYEIEYSNYVGRSVRVLTSELLEETPFKVALRKFENLVEEVELV